MPSQSIIQKPSKVSRAHNRLETAIERLETAIRNSAPGGGGNGQDPVQGSDQGPELSSLQNEIRSLKDENVNLKDTQRQVSGRLDAAVHRLKGLVGE